MRIHKNFLICSVICYAIAIYFIMFIPSGLSQIYLTNYIVDLISYLIMATIFLVIFARARLDIFQPYVFISVIYLLLFTIAPMIDIKQREFLWFGVDLFPYGIKGTLLALVGYMVFSIFYICAIKKEKIVKKEYIYNENRVRFLAIIGWLFCFLCSLKYFLTTGKGMSYILTLGFLTDTTEGSIGGASNLGFLAMFTYSLIPLCLIYFNFSKNKLIKYILLYTTLAIQLLRGFRFIVIILLGAMIIIYYLKRKRRPTLKVGLLILIGALLLIGIMGFYRNAIRSGNMHLLNWEEFDFSFIGDAVMGNLRIYKTYYSVIKAVPDMVDYMFGQQMFFYTAIMLIPRILWPAKPSNPGMEAVAVGISDYAVASGQAYPCLGEYYYEFGVLGILVFMSCFGILMRKIKNRYLYSHDILDIITIAIWIPSTLQLVIRGYTPSNVYLMLFLLMPIKLIRTLCQYRSHNREKKQWEE